MHPPGRIELKLDVEVVRDPIVHGGESWQGGEMSSQHIDEALWQGVPVEFSIEFHRAHVSLDLKMMSLSLKASSELNILDCEHVRRVCHREIVECDAALCIIQVAGSNVGRKTGCEDRLAPFVRQMECQGRKVSDVSFSLYLHVLARFLPFTIKHRLNVFVIYFQNAGSRHLVEVTMQKIVGKE